jgi:hypothetical protein
MLIPPNNKAIKPPPENRFDDTKKTEEPLKRPNNFLHNGQKIHGTTNSFVDYDELRYLVEKFGFGEVIECSCVHCTIERTRDVSLTTGPPVQVHLNFSVERLTELGLVGIYRGEVEPVWNPRI